MLLKKIACGGHSYVLCFNFVQDYIMFINYLCTTVTNVAKKFRLRRALVALYFNFFHDFIIFNNFFCTTMKNSVKKFLLRRGFITPVFFFFFIFFNFL